MNELETDSVIKLPKAVFRHCNEYRIISETITATLAFSKGEKGWLGDKLYESLMDGNVFTPTVAPTVWKKVE